MKYTVDLNKKLLNTDLVEIENADMFSVTKQLLGFHSKGNADLVWDILYTLKENEKEKIVEFTEKEIDFLRGTLVDSNEGTFSYIKEQVKRFYTSAKDQTTKPAK